MKSQLLLKWLTTYALLCVGLIATGRADDAVPDTVKPVPRADSKAWMDRHDKFNERVKEGNVDLLLIGDSITQGWEGSGKDVWNEYYTKRNAVNLGIGGDRTQHVLWRLENGNVDGIKPKLAVLMIGTNNAGANSAEEIGEGIQAIVKKLREKLPETKVLILAIFPRSEKPDAPARKERPGQQDRLAVGRRQNGLLSRHRRSVHETRWHADQGHHARLPASVSRGLRDLGQVDRAQGQGADGGIRGHKGPLPWLLPARSRWH